MTKAIAIIFTIFLFSSTVLAEDAGKWQVSKSTSAMDDTKTVVLNLNAENFIEGWLSETNPTIVLRCQENKTDIYIVTNVSANPEYGSYGRYTVRIRLDDGKPFKQKWSSSTDNKALFATKPIALAKEMVKAKKMLFEFTPFNASPQTIEFDIQGLRPHLEELAETCNWKI